MSSLVWSDCTSAATHARVGFMAPVLAWVPVT